MYEFALSMWRQGRLTAEQVAAFVTRGYITQEQADSILATAKA